MKERGRGERRSRVCERSGDMIVVCLFCLFDKRKRKKSKVGSGDIGRKGS